jgi:hypothetical protein
MKIMKTTFCWLMLMCALALTVSSQEGSAGDAPSAIRALEREWELAQSLNDNHAMEWIYDNALVYIEYGRLVTKSEYLERIHSENPSLRQVVMEPMTVRTFGNTAIVVGTYREIEIVNGKAGLQRWRFVDTWVYKKSGWVLVAAAAVQVTK